MIIIIHKITIKVTAQKLWWWAFDFIQLWVEPHICLKFWQEHFFSLFYQSTRHVSAAQYLSVNTYTLCPHFTHLLLLVWPCSLLYVLHTVSTGCLHVNWHPLWLCLQPPNNHRTTTLNGTDAKLTPPLPPPLTLHLSISFGYQIKTR